MIENKGMTLDEKKEMIQEIEILKKLVNECCSY